MLLRSLIAVLTFLTVGAYASTTAICVSTPASPSSLPPSLKKLSSRTDSNLATVYYSNNTSTASSTSTSASATPTGGCCFVVQDTVSEEWWQQTAYSTGQSVINLTSITTYVTPYVNGTITNVVTNVYLTNGTFSWPYTDGLNPITNYINAAPSVSEVADELDGTAVVTGGITVNSPAAFYVYNTIKIITVDAVTDDHGQTVCATPSSWDDTIESDGTVYTPTFTGINSNAEAYFGGLGVTAVSLVPTATVTHTLESIYSDDFLSTETYHSLEYDYATYFLNTAGETNDPNLAPTGAVISLSTPFIYQPDRGKDGARGKGQPCLQLDGNDNYGYVPQTLIDFLARDPAYLAQFPGLASCLPGGPSILKVTRCETVAYSIQSAVGGDLTSSTVITVTPVGGPRITATPSPQSQVVQSETVALTSVPLAGAIVEVATPSNPPPVSVPPNPPPNQDGQSSPTTTTQPLGAIINSIIGGVPANTPPPQGIVISSPTTIPVADAPAGLDGITTTIAGTPVIIVPAATTLPPAQDIVIPGPTTIPVAGAPAGLTGVTTTIAGTPFIIVPAATTLPGVPGPVGVVGATTTVIGGTPVVIIPGPTTIPVAAAPAGLTGSTTTINGTPFLIVPSRTTVPVSPTVAGLSTTTFGGVPFLIISSPTVIPVAGAPAGLSGSTTIISGTPFLVITAATTVPITPGATQSSTQTFPGRITTISGTEYEVFSGPTTVPVNPNVQLKGVTTVISGTTMVVVTGPTTVQVKATGSASAVNSAGAAAKSISWMALRGLVGAAAFLSVFC